ncbi:MAG: benzoate-CoA ligase family protein [Alphaproteobacteria bacterium]|nr:benzoate-CoA ligase family protein [Alphaproteobacteria bacterium]
MANYNAAADLIGRNLAAGRGAKTAVIDSRGIHSYADLDAATSRFAHALGTLGIRREERILLCLNDTADFHTCFLGAIRAGVVPVPVNTRLTQDDYAFMLRDSRAQAAFVSGNLAPVFTSLHDRVILDGAELAQLIGNESAAFPPAHTVEDEMCFWLYTSGTTGLPKGAVHLHGDMARTAALYAGPTLGVTEDDVLFSAAKLFFAYGLGNGLTFPMAAGAASVLLEGPPEPEPVCRLLRQARPTIFFGVPTLFAMLLASGEVPGPGAHALRLAVSAGEALPPEILRRWQEAVGVDILDGLGSTEMLHIFITNRVGDIVPGTSGRPVEGYDVRLVDDDDQVIEEPDALGALEVKGPTSAVFYWNRRARSVETFRGAWTRTGDKYVRDENGVYAFAGRADDMLKVGGIYVSPFEVEGALLKHEAVLEAAVVGAEDPDGLTKPKAFVVLQEGGTASARELQDFVRGQLAAYKYPRWVEFVDELPKTATGKIQRYKLRA